ncbi:hypothetical protein GGR52DRAFT_580494 [Hypoxylon sp. FL1284]|nr:hypothetical protein GGR52DRAFT_580494 [Hypoxylon sp. FL1284]
MNPPNFSLDDVEANHLTAPTTSQVTVVHDPQQHPAAEQSYHGETPSTPSPASQPTAVPYAPTPPPAPTPPSISSESEIYGPERLFGQQPLYENAGRSLIPSTPGSSFNQPQPQFMPMASPQELAFANQVKDDLARAAGVVTPGVDDGPYIRYALEAITRVRDDGRGLSGYPSSESDESYNPPYHFTPTAVPSPLKPTSAFLPPEMVGVFNAPRRLSVGPSPAPNPITPPRTTEDELRDGGEQQRWQPQSDMVTDPKLRLHGASDALRLASPLTRKPWVLRSQSLLLLAILCLLMITALIFSAVYSESRNGLTPYGGTIYGGQYFLFRVLPQLVAGILLIYAQCVINAAFWVLPFSAMASDDRNERRDAVFLPLYPKSFLWPQLYGSWYIWIPIFNVWLLNFTIPLQSCLFTVILVDGSWTWATVQGIAWTLVALYLSFALSLGVMFVFWHKRRTGMRQSWVIKTLADIILLVSESNSLSQYRGLETASTRRNMKQKLAGAAERLGFWFTPDAPEKGSWYGIGVPSGKEPTPAEKFESSEWANRQQQEESQLEAGRVTGPNVRYRYIPWCFRDSKIICFAVVSTLLLIALFVVSFLPSTDVRNGFLPLLSSGPTAGAFSPADFLYSFLPSLIGLVLFLLFQPLDLMLRILTPWGELARAEGSRAETSLLLDYSALKHKHWRVAYVSLMAPLFVLLPVLGGGLFMALTPADGIVRMYPNVPAFAVILTLLVLYVAGLVCLVPFRWQFRLPHAQVCVDEAFNVDRMLHPRDIAGRLDIGKDWHRQGRWIFSAGRNHDERLGIKRYSKYTRVRGQLISTPLPRDSGSLFNQ